MMILALLLADLTCLGSDDWKTRHETTERLTGSARGVLASKLFTGHPDPEVWLRLWLIGRDRFRQTPEPMQMPSERD